MRRRSGATPKRRRSQCSSFRASSKAATASSLTGLSGEALDRRFSATKRRHRSLGRSQATQAWIPIALRRRVVSA